MKLQKNDTIRKEPAVGDEIARQEQKLRDELDKELKRK